MDRKHGILWGGARAAVALGGMAWAASGTALATAPTDNPVAAFYSGDEGYPAWTDEIAWTRVVDMSTYAKGRTNFEKFESARDELAAAGGGVLYYPAGTYDFSEGPYDGPSGRGLMLKSGVVIRGEAPADRPVASESGELSLGTKFRFGFRQKAGHDVPKDWNIVGLAPEAGKGPESVRNVGIAWIDIAGGAIYFGPALKWGAFWATAKSWKSNYTKPAWRERKPDGTHPSDAFMGAPSPADGGGYVMGARGRLVFGCRLEKAAVLNDYDTCGRAESPKGFGEEGFHMAKFAARIAAYGSRVFVANNVVARTGEGNFIYEQTTVRAGPGPEGGNSFRIYDTRASSIMWDYNRVMGIDINKDMLGMVRESVLAAQEGGFFEEGVVIRDNWVFNHGHKGYNVSGKWITVRNNRNERLFLSGGAAVLGVGADWRLTLDGFIESSAGGGGMVSDNLARAFDVAGTAMWIGDNVFNNTGSSPGNDGEGICCQFHGGTHITSWAITGNRKEIGTSGGNGKGFIGGFAVDCRGLLVGWNETEGYAGALNMGRDSADVAIMANMAPNIMPCDLNLGTGLTAKVIYVPEGVPVAPALTNATVYQGDAVRVGWQDKSGKPDPAPAAEAGKRRRVDPCLVRETGYRVDRRIGDGAWYTIAFRPPQTVGHALNPPEWIDFTAPRGKPLVYRVVALSGHPRLGAPSQPSVAVQLP